MDLSPPAPPGVPLSWRPITGDDIAGWHRLVQAIEAADEPAERYTEYDLREELFDGSWKDPALDSLFGLDDDGVARAFGHVEVKPGDERVVRAFCWGGVDPAWRGRGIGRELLRWQVDLARRKIARAAKPVPGRITLYVEEPMTGLRHLAERAGFRAMRWSFEMTRPLDGDLPEMIVPDGLHLATFDGALSERVRRAHNEAFAEHWGSEPRDREDWERASVGGRYFRPAWSFVVLDGDDVAGYSLTSAYEQDWQAQGYTAGWTDALGVRARWRGRGVARALLAATMATLHRDGIDRADLGVDAENASGALELYRALGYRQARRDVTYGIDV